MQIFSVFVQNPALIVFFAGLFFLAYFLLRNRALLVPTIAWLAWAGWELAMTRFSPEADIRVDLLLIVPVVLIASIYGVVMVFMRHKNRIG